MSSGVISSRRSTRLSALACAVAAAGAGVLVRDVYDFEDTAAIVTLLAVCAAAGLAAALAALAWLRSLRAALLHGLVAAALVTPVVVLIYLVRMWTTADYS